MGRKAKGRTGEDELEAVADNVGGQGGDGGRAGLSIDVVCLREGK